MTLGNKTELLGKGFLLSAVSGALLLVGCNDTTEVNSPISEFSSTITADTIKNSAAHWLDSNSILIKTEQAGDEYFLCTTIGGKEQQIALKPKELSAALIEKYPHLTNFSAFHLDITPAQAKQWLKGEVTAQSFDKKNNKTSHYAYVQTGHVLDTLYTQDNSDADEINDLGATITEQGTQFKLWAPTAKSVSVLVYKKVNGDSAPDLELPLIEDVKTGTWQLTSNQAMPLNYYQYRIEVYHPESKKVETIITTDPYSLSLSTNSTHSQIVDLDDRATQPIGWQEHSVPAIAKPEDNILYETHIRDFSAADSSVKNEVVKGKYKAFSEKTSDGINHLKALRKAGLNNVHLLPAFDIGTVNENADEVISLDDPITKLCAQLDSAFGCDGQLPQDKSIREVLAGLDVSSADAQTLVSQMRQLDNYNWGYDPFHYTVPEGSYATDAMGTTRIVEFREMVQSLHQMGFRVIMDVVYNHTHQYGLAKNSVLDKIVPGYYHRLDPITGIVEQSTCYTCGNTATERVMVAKLMTDSLVTWAEDYKIDGFRFDLMGHQPKEAMLAAREAVRAVDPDTYFYGEGWNFGEVANNRQFIQASQLELGGTEIGTFSDRLRDAVRGPGNNTRDSQGIGTGLLTIPNERQNQADSKTQYQLRIDQVRIGLAGNLANFPLDQNTLGKDVPYGDQPTGYALDPADTVNYVSKHDNQTLWDNSQYRLPFETSTHDRVRLHNLSMAYVLYGQGIPFIHMGSEFLRSKSFLRDSYDYGDWFNAVDFTATTNNYNVGLPPADKDEGNWPLIREVILGHKGKDQPSSDDIKFARDSFINMLAVRTSSPLFSLATEQQIIDKVSFLNRDEDQHQQGLIVMLIDDKKGIPVDKQFEKVVVVFNSSASTQVVDLTPFADFVVHPALQKSMKDVSIDGEKGISIPALTAAVFVSPR